LQIGVLAIGLMASVTGWARNGLMETTFLNFYGTNGSMPGGELVQGADGLLYGTTFQGGAFGQGTIFSVTLGGSLTTLFSFNGTNGASPFPTPLQTSDRSMYGVTQAGGNTGQGTIYQLRSNGVLNTLYTFSDTNGSVPASLTFGHDGNLYGVARNGGVFTNKSNNLGYPDGVGDGTAFRVTTNGQFTFLLAFNGTNGEWPQVLLQGPDATFYGVTQLGGAYGYGTVFQMATNGQMRTLFSFAGTNGAQPLTLMQGSDGALYGITGIGGGGGGFNGPIVSTLSGFGTVFRITTNGSFSTLGLFDLTNGSVAMGTLLEVTNGVFLGTANSGGAAGSGFKGTLYQITTNGDMTVVIPFNQNNVLPYSPSGGVIKASDGNYYGATFDFSSNPSGGVTPGGQLFVVRPVQAPVVQSSVQNGQITLSWNAWGGYYYGIMYETNLIGSNWNSIIGGGITAPTNGITSYSDNIGPDPQRFYTVILQLP
jgi:uncharacterized repeat protein (TIGR03803 family)